MLENAKNTETFENLGITPGILARLKEMKFVKPTPIQFKAIPVATAGEDVVGIAQTGSGKTYAFSIPMIQSVMGTKNAGLILLPTRELAIQVSEAIVTLVGKNKLRTAIIIGGVNARPQVKQLRNSPQIIIATPGRLLDHLQQKNISLSNVTSLVLDEADRMLDMGFAPQLRQILAHVPVDRQTMLFSATMPEKITKMASSYMKKPLRIEIARPGTTAKTIDQEIFIVEKRDKLSLLGKLLIEYTGSVLIFTRTKYAAKKIADKVRIKGHTANELHSNRSQHQRQVALKGFSNGTYRVLVATDIAARGIDVEHLSLVVNFDLPMHAEDYTHRIGRTGRAGRTGKAISFAEPDQHADIVKIQRVINKVLPVKSPCGRRLASIHKAAAKVKKKNPQKKNKFGRRRKR